MNIILNGRPLDFTLEGEKNLFDIYTSVRNWLETQGGEIRAFISEGKDYTAADETDLTSKAVADVDTVEITTRGKRERIFDEMGILQEFFLLLHDAMEKKDTIAVRSILEEYTFVRGSLTFYLGDLFTSEAGLALETYRGLLAEEDFESAEAVEKKAFDFVGLVLRILNDRMQEMREPERESFAVAQLLRSAKNSVENVAILLQTGRDREAMQTVLSFIEIVLKSLRIIGFRGKQDDGVEEFCRSFNGTLNELTGAFSLKDSVLIGDLLEYEISPRIDRLAELLETESAV